MASTDDADTAGGHAAEAEPPPNPNAYQEFEAQVRSLQSRWRRRRTHHWFADVIQFLTLIAVVAAGVVAYWQLSAMNTNIQQAVTLNNLTEQSVGAAKDAAKAALESAQAARTSANMSEVQATAAKTQAGAATRANELSEIARRENFAIYREGQRARLSFNITTTSDPSVDNPELAFQMPIVITGNSDASRVRFAAAIYVVRSADPQRTLAIDWHDPKIQWVSADVIAAGEQNRVFRSRLKMSPSDVSAYQARSLDIGIRVRLEYCDAFGRRHFLDRCAERKAGADLTYCGVETDLNNGEETQPECRP